MIDSKNAVLIHGFEGRGDQGWFSETKNFLESNGYIVYNPDFPDTDNSSYSEWKKFFEENLLPKTNNETLFVAHSLGPTFLIRYLSENNLHIKTALFVSPAVRKNPDLPEIDEFFEGFDLPKVKKSIENIYVLYSNDPYIPQADFAYLISELDAQEVYIEGKEHFTQNENSNLDVLNILSKVVHDLQSGKNKIVIVNEDDEVIGHKERGSLELSDIYRVSALWLTNSKGEILLAQRAFAKSHSPGCWGPAVAGTVDEGEDYLKNIQKETEEEIGLTNVEFTKGQKLHRVGRGGHNYFVQWYFATVDKPAEDFMIQEDEVKAVKWFGKEELQKAIAEKPEEFLNHMSEYLEIFK